MSRSLPKLHGKRVTLRLATKEDIPQIIDFYKLNASHFEKVSSPKPKEFYTVEFWTQKVQKARNDFQNDFACSFFIFDIDDDSTVLGFVNFFSFIRGAFHACILGYGLAEVLQGRGLMTESLNLAIRYAFDELNLHRIMANHGAPNVRSAQVLRRLNFIPEGYARDYLLVNGRWQDHVLTALTNPIWLSPKETAAF